MGGGRRMRGGLSMEDDVPASGGKRIASRPRNRSAEHMFDLMGSTAVLAKEGKGVLYRCYVLWRIKSCIV